MQDRIWKRKRPYTPFGKGNGKNVTHTWLGRTVFKDLLLLLYRRHFPRDAARRGGSPHASDTRTCSQAGRFVVKSFTSLGCVLQYVTQEEAVEASKYIHGARQNVSEEINICACLYRPCTAASQCDSRCKQGVLLQSRMYKSK